MQLKYFTKVTVKQGTETPSAKIQRVSSGKAAPETFRNL